ncbi:MULTISPECIES: rhodanese-like domain-containing protein [Microcella]|jgi:rhodanese-related sulfurtransferase|uniref:rhodanese-like domain-containing protein n=1 Tax=Microcella TaxID=337004 RepID=UPI0015CF0FEA|nr:MULTISPECIES: rhodanese-like domain-containing protein [Microcella]MBU1249875.1 rhodanese-like domain-containing protein [Actinomycetota bacterium]MBU1609031.1 rhodanese-like domain-containing protein [Actinomycetota bacterium]MBU2316634.1 rhodanese-like domain-containing protein [Actinomycetota bacterium]MBU2384772.1 rhodanese-like domain-containing protein [Actinomycetota bacterium]QOD92874.1 rhodanese-like domain-containing protein [Chryseoglobus sp. 28M-23]
MAREIDVDELVLLREQGHPIIDVREPDEYAAAHVPGVRLIPLATIPDEADSLPRDETVYVICHSGARSLRAADYLLSVGVDAVSVAGGTSAWVQRGLDVERGSAA